jgi:hypothetical protein
VTAALNAALRKGVGSLRVPMRLSEVAWRTGRGRDRVACLLGETASLDLHFLTPLRIQRQKRELREFNLSELTRDLNFRIACWGHYHQDLPWAPRWPQLLEELQDVQVEDASIRCVRFERYSSRQGSAIPMSGLVGKVRLRNVGPGLRLLLALGEVCGAGKGASIGLGHFRLAAG